MRLLISSLTLVLVLTGCAVQQPYARVNDVSVNDSIDAGYLLVSIDGAPVRRARGEVATVVPVALVRPGTHTFELQSKRNPKAPPTTISAEVQADKEYRFAAKNNAVVLVETYSGPSPEPQAPSGTGSLLRAISGL